MPLILLLGIALLVSAVTIITKYTEGLAFRRAYRKHRFCAYTLVVTLALVVGILELLLNAKIVVFTVPSWLYFIHLTAALCYALSLFFKWRTSSPERRERHLWFSKPFWISWWMTAGTALFIGIWNAFIPLHF